MVRNVRTLEGKEYSTRKIRRVLVDSDEEDATVKVTVLKEKNRQSAQRSRDNKRRYIDGLELRLEELERENESLRQELSLCRCDRLSEGEGEGEGKREGKGESRDKSRDKERDKERDNERDKDSPNRSTACLMAEEATEEIGSESDVFERTSAKSVVSCSHFLMLAVVVVCCVFGLAEHTEPETYRGLYSLQTLEHIIKKANISQAEAPFPSAGWGGQRRPSRAECFMRGRERVEEKSAEKMEEKANQKMNQKTNQKTEPNTTTPPKFDPAVELSAEVTPIPRLVLHGK